MRRLVTHFESPECTDSTAATKSLTKTWRWMLPDIFFIYCVVGYVCVSVPGISIPTLYVYVS